MQLPEFTLKDEEQQFIINMLHASSFTSLDEFCRAHIKQDTAQDLVFSNDAVMADYISTHGLSLEALEQHMSSQMADFAYYSAMNAPQMASELCDSLLYYREAGRI